MGTVILAIVLLLATTARADDDLHIFALPVGQGDATIIQCPTPANTKGELVIIDIGSSSAQKTNDKGFMQIADIKEFIGKAGKHVENVFLTHPDKDHYNLIAAASTLMDDKTTIYHSCSLEDYDNCWMTNNDGTPKEQKHTLKQVIGDTVKYECIQKKDCSIKDTRDIGGICGGAVAITVLASELGGGKGSNEDSLVLQLKYKEQKALFVGDIEGEAIGKIAKCNNIESDILRLSHHGSVCNYANYYGFLNAVKPRYAFSSSDPCHHPYWIHPSCYIPSWLKFIDLSTSKRFIIHSIHPYTCRWPNNPDDHTVDIYYNDKYYGPCYSTTTTEDCDVNTFQHWVLDFKINKSIFSNDYVLHIDMIQWKKP